MSYYFVQANSADLMKCHILWVFTVCKSTRLGVSGQQRVYTMFLIAETNTIEHKINIQYFFRPSERKVCYTLFILDYHLPNVVIIYGPGYDKRYPMAL